MRTTLDLDPVVLTAARQLAADRSISLGRAVSELSLRGLQALKPAVATERGFPVFRSSPDAPVITLEHVKQLLDDEV